jgi:hypothetical protein
MIAQELAQLRFEVYIARDVAELSKSPISFDIGKMLDGELSSGPGFDRWVCVQFVKHEYGKDLDMGPDAALPCQVGGSPGVLRLLAPVHNGHKKGSARLKERNYNSISLNEDKKAPEPE